MTATILSGITARDARTLILTEKIKKLSHIPQLAIIQMGDRPDSTAYINAKKSFAKKVGIHVKHIHVPENTSQSDIIEQIRKCNADGTIQGIIVQVPLPEHIDRTTVIDAIDPTKDVDGLTSINFNKLISGDASAIVPATARGIHELCEYYSIVLKGKKIAVVGRSRLVGTPIALLSKRAGADVIICHSKTPDLAHETKQADIVIVAVGKPGLIGPAHIAHGAIVIDVGISKMADGTLVGDVDFDAVQELASAITPVPGGVGPMTVLGLFENIVDACR